MHSAIGFDQRHALWHRTGISCTIFLAVAGALRCCPPLAVPALRRVVRLAAHPATTAKLHNLFLRGAFQHAIYCPNAFSISPSSFLSSGVTLLE